MYRAFVSLKVVYRWMVAIDGVLKFINSRWKTSIKREFSRLINIAETMQCCPRAVCHRLWSVDMGCKHNASIPGGTLVLLLCVVRAIISLIKQTICPAVTDEIIRHERFRWRTVRERLLGYFRLPAACTDFTALNSINLAYSFTSRVTRNSPLEIGKCSSDAWKCTDYRCWAVYGTHKPPTLFVRLSILFTRSIDLEPDLQNILRFIVRLSKFIVRSTYDNDLQRASISLRNKCLS